LAGLGLSLNPMAAFAPPIPIPPTLSAEKTGSDITITITKTIAGGTYYVQATGVLGASASWAIISTNLIAGTHGITFVDTNAVAKFPIRFYRTYSPD